MSQDRLDTLASSKSAGFSLTELLVVMVMFGIITAAAYSLFREQGRISRTQQSILDMQSNGRAALNLLAQSFSHAGFGSSDTNDKFLDVKDDNPDTVTITYGHKHVANVASSIGTTPTNEVTYTLETDQTLAPGDTFCIYPSLTPNVTYTVKTAGSPLQIKDTDPNIVIVPINAKIYRVFPVKFSLNATDETLYMEDSDEETAIVFNVAAFEVAYLEEGATDWTQGTKLVSNPQAMYIYFILRTNEKEPGFKQGNPFVLHWKNSEKPSITIQDGYHYQSFETIVRIRNAS